MLLIAFFQQRTAPVENALRVFAVYRACDIGLLVAVFAMHNWAGTASFAGGLPPLTGSRASTVCLLLLLAAAGKAAQVPFSGWLPRAMEGPTPSSAIFYGAISIHAGAYLLLRVQPMLAQSSLASAMVIAIGLTTAIHGTMSGRASADAKTSLAYASLTQVGVVFVEIGIGWKWIAVAHILGHATVRTLQFLRAPSMLHDYHKMHSAIGGELSPTGKHLEELFSERAQLWLYRWSLDRGHLDTILDRFVIHPLMRLSRLFARLDSKGLDQSLKPAGSPGFQAHRRRPGGHLMAGGAVILTAVAIGVPWVAAILAAATRRHSRVIGFAAASVSVAASVLLLRAAPARESLDEALMVLFSCLTLGATLVLPRRDCNPGTISGILFLLGSTLLAYSTNNLWVLLSAWILSTVPFFPEQWFGVRTWRPRLGLLLSSAALALAITLIAAHGHAMSIAGLKGRNPGGMSVFGLLVVAVIFRKGICPAHAWVADAAEGGPAIPTALLLNGHFGAMLVAKLIVPLFPNTARDLFPLLSYLALATALYVAIRALTENSPRRLLAFLALSQSACILAGLESRTAEGITGALVHWFVVTVSTMGLFGILRLLEVRFGENLTASTTSWVGRARATAGGLLHRIWARAGWFAGHAELLFPRPSDSRNTGVAPADRAVAAHRHGHECGERFSLVRAAFPGQAENGFHRDGGCLAARAVDSDRGCLVRRFGRIVPERYCRAPRGGGGGGRASDLCAGATAATVCSTLSHGWAFPGTDVTSATDACGRCGEMYTLGFPRSQSGSPAQAAGRAGFVRNAVCGHQGGSYVSGNTMARSWNQS